MNQFNSLERRADKIEDALAGWGKPLDAGNLFDSPTLFTDAERRDWSAFWQRIGAAFQGETVHLRDVPSEDLAQLKAWATLYKERTEAQP